MKCEQRPISLRLLSLAVSLCMLFGLLPVTAFAEGTNVAKIDEVGYTSVNAAIEAAENGDTITLVTDVTEDVVIPEGKTLTLDLGGGYTLTNQSGHTITVKISAELTIRGTGTVDSVINGKGTIFNEGTVVLNGGTFKRSQEGAGNSWYTICNHGAMTINAGVEVENGGSSSSMIENGYYNYTDKNSANGYVSGTNHANPTLTINGGTFSGGMNSVKNDDGGVLEINDGTFKNTAGPVLLNWNEATINGGTFTATAADKAALANGAYPSTGVNKGILTIKGGTFTAGNDGEGVLFGYGIGANDGGEISIAGGAFEGNTNVTGLPYDISISGGTFSSKVPDEYLADGFVKETDKDGNTIIVNPNAPVVEPSKPAEKSDNTALIGALAVGAVAVTALSWKYLPVHKATGSVQDKEWNGLPGATVTLLRDGEVVRTVTTNAGGGYELYVPKGNYTLVVSYTVPETGEQVSASIEIAAPTSGYSGDIVLNW